MQRARYSYEYASSAAPHLSIYLQQMTEKNGQMALIYISKLQGTQHILRNFSLIIRDMS